MNLSIFFLLPDKRRHKGSLSFLSKIKSHFQQGCSFILLWLVLFAARGQVALYRARQKQRFTMPNAFLMRGPTRAPQPGIGLPVWDMAGPSLPLSGHRVTGITRTSSLHLRSSSPAVKPSEWDLKTLQIQEVMNKRGPVFHNNLLWNHSNLGTLEITWHWWKWFREQTFGVTLGVCVSVCV